MKLIEINQKVKEANKPLVYLFFLNSKGEVGNVIYQKGRYFMALPNKKLVQLNPLVEVVDWVSKVHNREWTLLGTGALEKEIPITSVNVMTMDQYKGDE